MTLTENDIRWVASLARLELTDEELHAWTGQLGKIVDYVDQLQTVDTEGVEPLAHPLPVQNVFRADEIQRSPEVEKALQNAPSQQDNFFTVPAVFDT